MKKAMIYMLQGIVLIALVLIGLTGIHYFFVVGVDLYQENALVNQCKAYAQENQVAFVSAINAFTYEEEPNHAVCLIDDLYEKLAFINQNNQLVLQRNAKSYVALDVYDASDNTQSYTLSLHNGKPVYIHKKIERNRLQTWYYCFDTKELLFLVDSEE